MRGERKFAGRAGGPSGRGGEGGEAVEGTLRPFETGGGRLGATKRLRRVDARDPEQHRGTGRDERAGDSAKLGKGLSLVTLSPLFANFRFPLAVETQRESRVSRKSSGERALAHRSHLVDFR